MEPVRINCHFYDSEIEKVQKDSFTIEHTPKSILFKDVPEEFAFSKEQAVEFIRLFQIRLQKIS